MSPRIALALLRAALAGCAGVPESQPAPAFAALAEVLSFFAEDGGRP